MMISLVHPSRQRLARAEAAIAEWRANASGTLPIEHILSVDADDPDLAGYRQLAARSGSRLVAHPNRRMVDAMNRGAAAATGDLLIGMSDDFGCPEQWDLLLAEIVEVAARDGVGDLIGLLDGVGHNRRKILFEVPRATGDGRAQRCHDFE